MRVCQFRHDGNLNCNAAAAPGPPCQEDEPTYFCSPPSACQTPTSLGSVLIFDSAFLSDLRESLAHFAVKGFLLREIRTPPAVAEARKPKPEARPTYPSFAVIVIFAFNTFDTGHPFSAASAYF